jgi:hypothetical protein
MHPRTFPHRSTNDSRPQQGLPGRERSRELAADIARDSGAATNAVARR